MKTVGLACLTVVAMNLHTAEILKVLECHDRVVQHGMETLDFAREVNSLFGATNVDHFISNFESKTHAPVWNSVTYFLGRYTFTLQVPISIDYENCRPTGATGSAIVYVNEVTKVEISTSGIAGATLKGGIGKLDDKQWKKLVANAGDWSVVGVPIFTNRTPITNFDAYVRQVREPIRNRKEGFDDPIRKALQSLRDGTYLAKTNSSPADCPDGLSRYEKVVCYGKHDVVANEFETFFGTANVDHFISKFGSKTQTPVWHSIAYFGGRYRAALQFPLSIDYQKCTPGGALASAFIQIHEITKVNVSKSGVSGATTRGQWELGPNEWKWLLKNKGDWSVVKVPINTKAPVKDFDKYVKLERGRPLAIRQEEFDKPIRKVIDGLGYGASFGRGTATNSTPRP